MRGGRKKFQWQQKLVGITPTEDLRRFLTGLGLDVKHMTREQLYGESIRVLTDRTEPARAKNFLDYLMLNLTYGLKGV